MKNNQRFHPRAWLATALCASLGACAVGPNYTKPDVEVPGTYKEAGPNGQADKQEATLQAQASAQAEPTARSNAQVRAKEAGPAMHASGPTDAQKAAAATQTDALTGSVWKPVEPADAIKRGAWWEIFGDAILNQYEERIEASNQSLAQAEAQYMQARALVSEARASYFPTAGVSFSATRSERAQGSIGTSGTVGTGQSGETGFVTKNPSNAYSLPFTASWEPDLWGKVRRTVEENAANAQASAATLESTRLSLQAELATDYFQLRITDEQQRLLDDTVKEYQKSLKLTQNQYAVGVAARADVVTSEAQLKQAQAQEIDLGIMRAQLEHAIALLVGKTPSDVSIAVEKLTIKPPQIPVGLPSQLLERRPDVAVAERQAQAASAQIGIAISAYFPSLTLSGSGGWQSSTLSNLISAPNRVWSIGPQLAETLFDGGLRRSQTAQARAGYDAAVANYRETALAAFQNVEDNLAALRILETESVVQADAVKAAKEALKITLNQYRAGTVSYLNVVTAQATAYGDERQAITLLGTQLSDSVALIKAIGGGWQDSDLPSAGDISYRAPMKQGTQ